MPNGGAGAHKRADYSDLAGRQTRRRPGPLPSRWPRLIPSRIAPEILLRDSGPSPQQRAYGVSRPVRVYGQVPCRLKDCGITVLGTHSAVRLIGRCCGRKVGKEEKRRYRATKRGSSSHPRCCQWPWCRPRIFLPPAPCLRTRAGGLFCETGTPPGRESHSMCAN